MGLREYQTEDLSSVADCYNRGERRLLGVWPTGSGKTLALASLPSFVKTPGKTIIILNRTELVQQTIDKISKYNPTARVGVEKAGSYHDSSDDVIIASIQTIGSAKENEDGTPFFNKRLRSLNPDEFGTVIVDESHRALSPIYRTALRWLKVYKDEPEYNDPNKLLLCLTATPNRSDNKGLEEICSTVAFSRDIRWGIQNGWLTDIIAWRCNTSIDISDTKITAGDFNQKQLSNKINVPKRNELVVKEYQKIAAGKKALFFCIDIQHSEDLATEFNKQGIRTFAVHSKTPDKIREKVFQLHRNGYYTVLTGCGVFLEGYDDPTIEVIGMVRPTKSGLLYRQAIGRGLRPYPAPEEVAAIRADGREPEWIKPACIVIDFVDVSSRHSLITAPTLFGLSPNLDLKGKKAVETVEELEDKLKKLSAAKQATTNLSLFDDLTKLHAHMERVDLLSVPSTPDEIKAVSELSWIGSGVSYQLSLPDNTFSIKQNTLGGFDCHKITKGMLQFIDSFQSLEKAVSAVEGRLLDNEYSFAKANQKWRKDPPNEGQVNLLAMLDLEGVRRHNGRENYKANVRETLTKGQVSQMISKLPKPKWWKERE